LEVVGRHGTENIKEVKSTILGTYLMSKMEKSRKTPGVSFGQMDDGSILKRATTKEVDGGREEIKYSGVSVRFLLL
jgi:hypothetical protein